MLRIKVGTNTNTRTELVDCNSTPAEILEKMQVRTTGATISLNGRALSAAEAGKTFADLGIADGSDQNFLVAAVKADSAAVKTAIVSVAGKKSLVITTGIKESAYRKGITNLAAYDKDGEPVFQLTIDKDATTGSIDKWGATVNGVQDGEFAVVIPVAGNVKAEDIKAAYGSKCVAAAAGLEILGAQMAKEATDVDAMFAGITGETQQ